MSIGIRTNDMPMFLHQMIKVLLIMGFLTSQPSVYAQSNNLEQSACAGSQDVLHPVDTLSTDSTSVSKKYRADSSVFNAKQLILPGVLIAVGTWGIYNGGLRKLEVNIKNEMDNLRGDHFFRVDNYIQYLPAITYLAFGSIGIESKHTFRERIAVEATAYIAMTALTNLGKYTFKERRPDSNARNSFPSGHTATVFTGAELMREEYGTGIGIGAYSIAVGVAFLRLYNGRHWLNDVIAGAGVGILSARIGYWMLPLYRKWFKWDKACSNIMVMSPTYNPSEHSLSINLSYTF